MIENCSTDCRSALEKFSSCSGCCIHMGGLSFNNLVNHGGFSPCFCGPDVGKETSVDYSHSISQGNIPSQYTANAIIFTLAMNVPWNVKLHLKRNGGCVWLLLKCNEYN